MNVCDLCNAPLDARSIRYTADQFRKGVKAGLRPNATTLMLGEAMGMPKEAMQQAWIKQVMTDGTDWMLCPSCSTRYRQYVPEKQWWQFWK